VRDVVSTADCAAAEPAGHLTYDAVHVWQAWLDAPEPHVRVLAHALSPDECVRAESYHFERDRRRFTVCRGLLRTILGRYLAQPADRLRFEYGTRGKPALARSEHDGALRFNVSHSGGCALFAVTRGREVGVDLEQVRPLAGPERIAERFFSVPERVALRELPAHGRLEAFFTCWTRKEAYVKGRGEGLAHPLDAFAVSVRPDQPAVLRAAEGGDVEELSRWSLSALPQPPGYVAALAAEGHGWRVSSWSWPRQV
jgi:4'-phosphopantetheinyl transferase